MISYNVWSHHFNLIDVEKDSQCACCGAKEFTFLNREPNEIITRLCDNAVQIIPRQDRNLDLQKIATNLDQSVSASHIIATEFLLKFQADDKGMTLFKDGRAIIKGTGDKGAAKSFYSRYLMI